MHIVFFNRSFWPDVESTGQLLSELCESLSRWHRVTAVVGRPYNMQRFGSWWPLRREQRGQVRILRAYNPKLPKRHFPFRVINLSSYFVLSLLGGFLIEPPEVIVVQTDPPVLGLLGGLFSWLYGAKLVFAVKDLYPDIGVALGKLRNPLIIGFLRACTRFTLRRADLVLVLGEDMKRRVLDYGCVPAARVVVAPDGVDTAALAPPSGANSFRRERGWGDSFVVMYSGNLGLSQGLSTIVEIAQQLRSEPRLHFVLIGDGAAKPALVSQAAALKLRNLEFLPYQPKERLSETLSAADLHLVPLEPGLSGLIVPSKVYGILAAGRPYLASGEADSEAVTIARRHRCGLWTAAGDKDALIHQIRWAQDHRAELAAMGQRGRAVAVADYDSRRCAERIRQQLEALVASSALQK